MSAQDPSSAQPAATAATRLDTAPTTIDSNPTRLDRSGASLAETPTVLDTEHKAAVNTTVGLIQLPSEIRNRYRVQSRLPTAGAEADLFVVQATDGIDAELHVLKLYRFGIQPKADVLEKVRAGNPEHLIRIHEFGQSDGHWYEIMEYVAHGSFRQLLRGRALPQQSLLEVIRELAIGLEHLHGFGLIHRDLKPENILARETFPLDLVITDFGISSVTEMSQRFTSASRTVRYAAPEALSGVISTAVDYWSLGMIVAEAATGHHPFAQLSDERAVMQWLTTRPIDISEPPAATQSAYMVRPRRTSFRRCDSLKGLLPYIRAVFAVGAAAHDGCSRLELLPPGCTQGTGGSSECLQPGLTFIPSLRFLQVLLQNGSGQSPAGLMLKRSSIRCLLVQADAT